MSTFNETDHPRRGDGKWATKTLDETDPGLGDELDGDRSYEEGLDWEDAGYGAMHAERDDGSVLTVTPQDEEDWIAGPCVWKVQTAGGVVDLGTAADREDAMNQAETQADRLGADRKVQDLVDSIQYRKPVEPKDDLPQIGMSASQWQTKTGAGRRNIPGCENVDTVANKFRAGALSERGVCAEVFGSNSPQHNQGHNLFGLRPVDGPIVDPTPNETTEALGFTRDRYGADGPFVPGYSELGFNPDEGFDWYRHNFGPNEATEMSSAGFTPSEASFVMGRSSVSDIDAAVAYRDSVRGKMADRTAAVEALGLRSAEWAEAGFADDPTGAAEWKRRGFTPVEAAEAAGAEADRG